MTGRRYPRIRAMLMDHGHTKTRADEIIHDALLRDPWAIAWIRYIWSKR